MCKPVVGPSGCSGEAAGSLLPAILESVLSPASLLCPHVIQNWLTCD